jgi:hypothetical protein
MLLLIEIDFAGESKRLGQSRALPVMYDDAITARLPLS